MAVEAVKVEIGLCASAFADRPLEDALRRVRELGMSLVDLPTDSVFTLAGFMGPEGGGGRARLRDLLAELEIRVACVSNSRDCQLLLGPYGAHTDSVAGGDVETRKAHAQRHALAAIELAALVGAPIVRLFLGCPDFARWLRWPGSDVSWDDNVEEFVEVAAGLAKAADQAGVTLCIEPHVKQVPYDPRSVRACVSGVRATGADLALCFDPANVAALHYDPVEFLTAVGITPACLHAKDVELASAVELAPSCLVPPGPGWVSYGPHPPIRFRSVPWGTLDWRAILTRLQETGFSGPILIEHEDVLVERSAGIAGAKRYLESLLAESGLLEPGPGKAWW